MAEAQRRLTTIVAADIAGFSRLVGADEEGTLAAQRRHREELIQPLLDEHHGRVANTAGDSFLFEFPSAVEAVRCAIAVQDGMARRNEVVPADRRIEYRIGINVGDVLAEGHDLLGDGVNVAARLEGIAEPGGICLSNAAYEQVRDRLDIAFEDMGEVEVKNIGRPVRVYRVLAEGVGEGAVSPPRGPAHWLKYVAGVFVAIAVLAAGGLWWWQPWVEQMEPARPDKISSEIPDKPSIAILPFANLSDDRAQEYFADGMTDDLITDLSKVSGLIVVARNSVFTYKGKNVKVQDVAKDLNVTHVLEGSVRRANDKVRINAQLIDANSGNHLWAERFDRDFNDVFKLQDEITARIAEALKVALTPGEELALAKPPTESVEAYEHYLQAESLRLTYDGAHFQSAIYLYRMALSHDPEFVAAHLGLAKSLIRVWRNGWTHVMTDPGEGLVQAREALAAIDRLAPGHAGAAAQNIRLNMQFDLDAARKLAEAAVLQHPNSSELYLRLSQTLNALGMHDGALEAVKRALLLSPRPDTEFWPEMAQEFAYLRKGDRAIYLVKRAREVGADNFETAFEMIRALVARGDVAASKNEIAHITERWPSVNLNRSRLWFQHYRDPEWDARLIAPLAKAGIPEWPYGVKIDETKRVGRKELERLFKPPHIIHGATFTVTGLKDDLLCVNRSWIAMGRSYCAPVYRDPEFMEKYNATIYDLDLIVMSVHHPGYDLFKVTRDE